MCRAYLGDYKATEADLCFPSNITPKLPETSMDEMVSRHVRTRESTVGRHRIVRFVCYDNGGGAEGQGW